MVGSLIPPGVLGNVKRICAEVVSAAAKANRPVRNVWGYNSEPDHNNKRCIDFMVTDRTRGDWVAGYIWKHRKRLGLDLLIWNRRIRRNYRKGLIPAGAWARYTGASSHTDHVHAQFKAGDYVPPSTGHLGVYVVDPAEVDTWLWEIRRDGTQGKKRRPGFRIRDGVDIIERDGRKWLLVATGSRYALDFLKRE